MENLRLRLVSDQLSKVLAWNFVGTAFTLSDDGWKYLCPNDKGRKLLTKKVYYRIITQSKQISFVLFDSQKKDYDDIMSVIGFIQIISPKQKHDIPNLLIKCLDYLLLAPLNLEDGLSFIWRTMQITASINLIHQLVTQSISEYWYFDHLCIRKSDQRNGKGRVLLNLAHQKCLMDHDYSNAPILVTTFSANTVQFYVSMGYLLIKQITVDTSTNCKCYALLYHTNKKQLQTHIKQFKEKNKFTQKLQLRHILPNSISRWLLLINCLVLLFPFAIIYLPAALLARKIDPGDVWDQ